MVWAKQLLYHVYIFLVVKRMTRMGMTLTLRKLRRGRMEKMVALEHAKKIEMWWSCCTRTVVGCCNWRVWKTHQPILRLKVAVDDVAVSVQRPMFL